MRAWIALGVVCGLVASAVAESPRKKPARAVVFVIDRSGSMQGPRLEAAKTSVGAALDVLAPADTVAVVAFDSEATILVKPQAVKNKKQIRADLAQLKAGGGTNIFPGLKEARDILGGVTATKKHVIVLSDGEAPYDGIDELVTEMKGAGTTVSAIGIPSADRVLLGKIADAGAGRLYMLEDLGALPKVFVKEVREGLR
jgi:Ca-activated chloride channel family protein